MNRDKSFLEICLDVVTKLVLKGTYCPQHNTSHHQRTIIPTFLVTALVPIKIKKMMKGLKSSAFERLIGYFITLMISAITDL